MEATARRWQEGQIPSRTLEVRGRGSISMFLFALFSFYFFGLGLITPATYASKGKWNALIPFFLSEGIGYLILGGFFGSLFLAFWRTRIRYHVVDIHSWGLKLEGPYYRQEIPFNEIASARFEKRFFAFHHLILERRDGIDFHFPYAIERPEYLLQALESARPDLTKYLNLEEFKKDAIVADHRISRWQGRTLSFTLRSLFLSPAFVICAYLIFYTQNQKFHDLMTGSSALYWVLSDWLRIVILDLIILVGIEAFFTLRTKQQLAENSKNAIRDRHLEQRVFRAHALVYLGFALLPYALVLLYNW